jgi:hypothetical protein
MKKLSSEQCVQYANELSAALALENIKGVNQLLDTLFETENLHSFLSIKPLVALTQSENTYLQQIAKFYESQKQHAMLITFLARLKRSGYKKLNVKIDYIGTDFLVAGLNKVPDDFLYLLEDDFIAPAQTVYDAMLKSENDLPNNLALKEALLYLCRQGVRLVGSRDLTENSKKFNFLEKFQKNNFFRLLPVLALHEQLVQGVIVIEFVGFFDKCVIETYLFDELFQNRQYSRSSINIRIMELRQLIAINSDYAKRKDKMLYVINKYVEHIPFYQHQFELPHPVRSYAKKLNNFSSASDSRAALVKGFYEEGGIARLMSAYFTDASGKSIPVEKTTVDSLHNSLRRFISDDFRPFAFAAIQKCIDDDKTLPTLSALILHKDLPQNIKNVLCYLVDRLTHPEYKDYLSQIEMAELPNENDKTPSLSIAPTLTLYGTAGQVVASSKAEVAATPQNTPEQPTDSPQLSF